MWRRKPSVASSPLHVLIAFETACAGPPPYPTCVPFPSPTDYTSPAVPASPCLLPRLQSFHLWSQEGPFHSLPTMHLYPSCSPRLPSCSTSGCSPPAASMAMSISQLWLPQQAPQMRRGVGLGVNVLNNRHLSFQSPGSQKAEIRVSADVVSPEASLLGLQTVALCCVLCVSTARGLLSFQGLPSSWHCP